MSQLSGNLGFSIQISDMFGCQSLVRFEMGHWFLRTWRCRDGFPLILCFKTQCCCPPNVYRLAVWHQIELLLFNLWGIISVIELIQTIF